MLATKFVVLSFGFMVFKYTFVIHNCKVEAGPGLAGRYGQRVETGIHRSGGLLPITRWTRFRPDTTVTRLIPPARRRHKVGRCDAGGNRRLDAKLVNKARALMSGFHQKERPRYVEEQERRQQRHKDPES